MAMRRPHGISRSIIIDHNRSLTTRRFPRLLEILLDQALVVLHLNWLVPFVTCISHNHLRGSRFLNNLSERERVKLSSLSLTAKLDFLLVSLATLTKYYVSLGGTILTLTPNIVKFAVSHPFYSQSTYPRTRCSRCIRAASWIRSTREINRSLRILRQLPKWPKCQSTKGKTPSFFSTYASTVVEINFIRTWQ